METDCRIDGGSWQYTKEWDDPETDPCYLEGMTDSNLIFCENEEDSPCRWCDYRTLCRVRRESRRPRNEQTTYRDIAGKNTAKNKIAESGKMAYNQNS